MKKLLSIILAATMTVTMLASTAFAASDAENGDWSQKTVVLKKHK